MLCLPDIRDILAYLIYITVARFAVLAQLAPVQEWPMPP